jgi:hypothetical protein
LDERITQAGHSSGAMTLAQVLRYFCQQEKTVVLVGPRSSWSNHNFFEEAFHQEM